MRKLFDRWKSRQMAVIKGWQRLFRAMIAGVTLVCGLPGSSAAERAQHKPNRGVSTVRSLDADEIHKIVRECGTKELREEALKKLRDAYSSQKLATLQIAVAICLEHGAEDERKDALQQYLLAATPSSDPIDVTWARRRYEYLSEVHPKSAGPFSEGSASGDLRNGPMISTSAEGSSLLASGSAPLASSTMTQSRGPVQGPAASAQRVSPPVIEPPAVPPLLVWLSGTAPPVPGNQPVQPLPASPCWDRDPNRKPNLLIAGGVIGGLGLGGLITGAALWGLHGQPNGRTNCDHDGVPTGCKWDAAAGGTAALIAGGVGFGVGTALITVSLVKKKEPPCPSRKP